MKMALIHDWLITPGGAEKVLESFEELFKAPIYTLFYDPKKMSRSSLSRSEIHTSFLQKTPFSSSIYRHLLPLFPMAIKTFDLSSYDVILSGSHAVAKGVITRENQLHICYCYTPMRYAWDLQEAYLRPLNPIMRGIARVILESIRKWDLKTSENVDFFIASSSYIAERIARAYQREAVVIYPPVAVEDFFLSNHREEYYVTHARLVPYKRIDLLVEAFSYMPDKKLVVIGTGPEDKKLRKMAKKNVEFLGYVGGKELSKLLAEAKAYVFAAEEDFGIGVVEAQSSGLPVIALGKGGALETVVDGKTGLFFLEPTVPSFIEAIKSFEKKEKTFDPLVIRKHAEFFSKERFETELYQFIEEARQKFYENHHSCRR